MNFNEYPAFLTLLTSMSCVFCLSSALADFFKRELFNDVTTQIKAFSNMLKMLVYILYNKM